jgi:hypothetical protein
MVAMTTKKSAQPSHTNKIKGLAKSDLESEYAKYFTHQPQPSGYDPYEQVTLFDYSVPVTTGASTVDL